MKNPLIARSDAFYKTLVGSLQMGLYACDVDGRIIYFNETVSELWGQKPQDDSRFWLFHKAWFPDGSLIIPGESPMAIAVRTGRPYAGLQMWVEKPDGTRYYAGMQIDVIRNEEGIVTGGVATIRDITDDTATAKAFIENEVRYRQLIRSLPVATYLCDPAGQITVYNDAAMGLWGREPDAADRWSGAWRIFSESGMLLSHEDTPTARALREGRAFNSQVLIFEKPDGTRSWVIPHATPMFDRDGNIEGVVNMMIDITGERKSQQVLEENMERLRLAVDTAALGTWDVDLATMEIITSRRHQQIFGYSGRTPWTREKFLARAHPDDREWVSKQFDQAKESGNMFYEARILRRKKIRWIRVNGITLYQEGVPVRILGTILDITAEKKANEDLENIVEKRTRELRRSNRQLEKSNHELEQFAYIASHDLQEPLRKIQTFATLVDNVDNEAARRKYLLKIREEAQGMSALVRDVLMFSRLSVIPEFDYVDLTTIIEDVTAELSLIIADKRATLTVGRLPAVMGIPRQLAQLVSNIISNSLKFSTSSPTITIAAREVLREEIGAFPRLRRDRDFVLLEIRDNGIGFEQKYSEQIFQIFQRLNPREAYPGNGIGLALCRKIVDNHHGIITASSEPGVGTTISIILPAAIKRDVGE